MNFYVILFCVFACLKILHNPKICLKIEDFLMLACVCIDSSRIYVVFVVIARLPLGSRDNLYF
ncbi:hypothetical protein HFN_1174 [Helicobacter fennelliae MRY12-0050]|uniref:Uncharacterized protein n=1 Tax=Helicobacter fennelliae MRY12-0050 TaxID=1325130 RepID=T1CSX6_9HELI|nr:hypothetical protein HFN_1174 [Helicobacter fennelliae MRY12-0050]